MKSYAQYDDSGNLVCVGTVTTERHIPGEISAEEYEALRATIPEPEQPQTVDDIDEALAILSGEVLA